MIPLMKRWFKDLHHGPDYYDNQMKNNQLAKTIVIKFIIMVMIVLLVYMLWGWECSGHCL